MKNPTLRRLTGLLAVGFLLTACGTESDHKIKLASDDGLASETPQTASSVLRISPEQQRTIAILYFHNETRDSSLDWLERGLTDMLSTELSQSPFLEVVPVKRLSYLSQNLGYKLEEIRDPTMARKIARKAGAEIFFTGRFYRQTESLAIDVKIFEIRNGRLLYQETVRGKGMEQIFKMVDNLSGKVRTNLREDSPGLPASRTDLASMTRSVDAFKRYSEALENMDKLLYREAAIDLEEAIKLDTTFAAAYLRLARLNMNSGNNPRMKAALQKIRKYRKKLSQSDKIYLKLIETRFSGNYDRLLPILEEAVQRIPNDPDLRLELARYYHLTLGKLEKALTEYEKVIELDPQRKIVYNQLGYLFAQRGDFTTALKNINRYQELAPDEANPYDSKGELLMMAGRFREAEFQLKTALAKWPTFSFSAIRLSQLYIETGDYRQAMTYLQQAQAGRVDENLLFEVQLFRVYLYWRSEKRNVLKRELKKMTEKFPGSLRAAGLAGEIYKSLGDTARANRIYQNVFQQFEKYVLEGKAGPEYIGKTIFFMAAANLPPEKVLPVLEKLASSPHSDEVKSGIEFGLSIFYLRSGQEAAANKIFTEYGAMMTRGLVSNTRNGWGSLWKYVFETLRENDPDGTIRFANELEKAAQKVGRADLTALSGLIRGLGYEASGDDSAALSEYRKIGMPRETKWNIIGPFKVKNASNLKYSFPPETMLNLDNGFVLNGKNLRWARANDGYNDGYVDLRTIFRQHNWTAAYAQVYVHSPDSRKVQIRLGTDEATKVWLNRKLIWQHYLRMDARMDRDLITVVLHPGDNNLLLKVTNTDFDWGFYLRITDEKGNGFPDITFHNRPQKPEVAVIN